MDKDILRQIADSINQIKTDPRHSRQAAYALVDNLLEVAAFEHYSREQKKEIIAKADNLRNKPYSIIPSLIQITTDADIKEMLAEIGVALARQSESPGYACRFLRETGLPDNSPSRAAILQAAIDHLPNISVSYGSDPDKPSEAANAVLWECRTPEETAAVTAQIGKIAQTMNSVLLRSYILGLSTQDETNYFDEIMNAVLPALSKLDPQDSLFIIRRKITESSPETKEKLVNFAMEIIEAKGTKEIELYVCGLIKDMAQEDPRRERLISKLISDAPSHKDAIFIALELQSLNDAEKFIEIANEEIEAIPATERIEVLQKACLPKNHWGEIEEVSGSAWAKDKILVAIKSLEPVQAIEQCLNMNQYMFEKIYNEMDPHYPRAVNEPFILQALSILPNVPQKDRLNAARDILFAIPHYSDHKDAATAAYLELVGGLKPAKRLVEAQNTMDAHIGTQYRPSDKDQFGPGYDAAQVLFVQIPDLMESKKKIPFRDVEKYVAWARTMRSEDFDQDRIADMAIKAVERENAADRHYYLTKIAWNFDNEPAKNRILLAAAECLECLPVDRRFDKAFAFAVGKSRHDPDGGLLNPVAMRSMEVAIKSIAHLPEDRQDEAVKCVFDAAADYPAVREALVAAHADKIPAPPAPMDVATFLRLDMP